MLCLSTFFLFFNAANVKSFFFAAKFLLLIFRFINNYFFCLEKFVIKNLRNIKNLAFISKRRNFFFKITTL